MRMLMDEELKEENPEDEFFDNLKMDVATYDALERKITTTTVSDSGDIQFKTVDGRECAYVNSTYFLKEGESDFSRSVQCYVLREDEAERWKIVGFYLVEGDSLND